MKDLPSPQDSRIPPWAGLAARVAVGLLFIVTGTLKASAPAEEFSVVIESYQIISPSASLTAATFLPWVELFIGFSLLFGYFTKAAAAAAGGLLLSFLGALLSTKARGIVLPNCGCFGMGLHPSTSVTMAMDSLSAALAFVAFKRGDRLASLDGWVEGAGKN